MARKRKGDGQSALVTGASAGIGVDLAECFAKDGYGLILTARSEAALADVATRLGKTYNVPTAIIPLDLGVPGGGEKLAAEIASRGLSVDVLVNNAGFGHAGAFDSSPAAEELGMIDLNVRALVELTHIFWPRMLANKRGGVLNVASTAAFQPGPLMAVYYASKAFVLSFSEALWKEAEKTGVHVSCLCPGPTASKFRERAGTGKTKLSRVGTPMPSMSVARMGYRAFRNNKRVMITGGRNKLLARLAPFLPRTMLLSTVHNLQSPA
jgi:short-subunit dehydrogenase